ncbi:PAAR domain-containing protein [Agrobacterium sp. BA1120]|uniref:PAAR domain-containing protein n=1 Tax=Agrobacterium sp. BA1120 TaxID=3228927 RepID=UPI00336ACCD6
MAQAHRRADIGSAHSCHFPPTPATGGSRDVFVNDQPLVGVGDAYELHGCPSCPKPSHARSRASGSATVFINGKAAGRVGDAIDCGGNAQTGSFNVYSGDDSSCARPNDGTPF